MKIAIDIRPLRDVMTGIGRYLYKLIESLGECDRQNEYLLFWSNLKIPPPEGLPKRDNIRTLAFRVPGKMVTALWAYTPFPPVEAFTGEIDVFHAPCFQVPPARRAARIFTIHDLIPVTHPEMAIPSSVRHFRPRVKAYARRADLIVAISEATARDIVDYLDVPREKIVVIYQGTTFLPKAPEEQVRAVRKRYMLEKDYILFVSRLDPRKNLARLFLAFERSGLSKDFDLVIAGPKGWHMEEMTRTWQDISCKKEIRWLDYIKDDELSALYGGAVFLAFPSLLEGFGLPILEAMSVGCPVLTSNVSSMPEVGGEAALYVDPYEVDSIADGLVRLVGDSTLRAKLSTAGHERVKIFTWDKTARQMIEAYGRASEMARSKSK